MDGRRSVLVHRRDDTSPLADYKLSLNHRQRSDAEASPHEDEHDNDSRRSRSEAPSDDATIPVAAASPAPLPSATDHSGALMGYTVYLYCIAAARANTYDTWTKAGSILKRCGLRQ